MTWAAVAVGGGALLGGLLSSQGAQSAADTQAGAAEYAAQIGLQEFNTITSQEQPFMQGGYGALGALEQGLGLSAPSPVTAPSPFGGYGSVLPGYDPSSGYSIGANGAITQLIPSPIGASATTGGGATTGTNQGLPAGVSISPSGIPYRTFTGTGSAHDNLVANNTPGANLTPTANYPGSGFNNGSLGGSRVPIASNGGPVQRTGAIGPPGGAPGNSSVGFGSLIQPFTAENWQQLSPEYGFLLEQGQQGVLNGSSAGSGALSGAAQKDLMSFNQNLANTSFGNAFNMYQTQQGNIYQRLAGLTQLGQAAAANTGQQGTALTGQIGQAITNAGTAQAAGQVGVANAWSGALNNMSYMPWLYNQAPSSYSGGGNTMDAGGGYTFSY